MAVGQDAWPPGPRAFRKLALAGEEGERTGMHALYLPAPMKAPMDRETVVAGLAELRARLPSADVPSNDQLPASACTPAERRRFIQRKQEELVAAGLGCFLAEAELAKTRDPEPRLVNVVALPDREAA